MPKPPSELTRDQIEILRAQLLAARRDALGISKLSTGDVEQPDVGDEMDVAAVAGDTEESAARTNRNAARLADIDDALAKLERGEYGVSEQSGEPIGFGRLHAIPWVRLTVLEEEELERR